MLSLFKEKQINDCLPLLSKACLLRFLYTYFDLFTINDVGHKLIASKNIYIFVIIYKQINFQHLHI